MKTEREVREKYNAFLIIRDNASVTEYKAEVETTIACLLWILKCEDCKSYPCTCDEPF